MPTPKQEKEKPREPKEVVRTFQSAKGMHDVLPSDEPYWEKIESVARLARDGVWIFADRTADFGIRRAL